MNNKCKKIWGIDPENQVVTSVEIRDAIVECFKNAHNEVLEEMKEFQNFESDEEFEKIKHLNVKMLVKKYIKDNNGNFDNPSKKDLYNLIKNLEEYAANFRRPDIIDKHKEEILLLINKL